ncbi:unnamed protein product [Lasius platythorax]|uniref:Uncharacterized protein n=1 Tax=Lasius platythorax TaxID=488582 RepID=A0AAV2NK64_9HYME
MKLHRESSNSSAYLSNGEVSSYFEPRSHRKLSIDEVHSNEAFVCTLQQSVRWNYYEEVRTRDFPRINLVFVSRSREDIVFHRQSIFYRDKWHSISRCGIPRVLRHQFSRYSWHPTASGETCEKRGGRGRRREFKYSVFADETDSKKVQFHGGGRARRKNKDEARRREKDRRRRRKDPRFVSA